jgi:death-on-curing protein
MTPRFLGVEEVMRIHARSLDSFGGLPGLRDPGALESAVQAVRNHFLYTGGDLFDLAAVLLWHLGRNPPFADGNKRAAVAAALVFLDLNGIQFAQDDDLFESLTLTVAAGGMERDDLAARLRSAKLA